MTNEIVIRFTTPAAKHNHPVVFGRKVDGCPRCAELLAGAPVIRWAPSRQQQDARRVAEVRAHNCVASNCGPVCTFGDW
jgi:hypothetical protein